jgi:hypothetical protein
MSKKDYDTIAKVLSRWRGQADSVVAAIVCDLADEFAHDNPKFSNHKWHDACQAYRRG